MPEGQSWLEYWRPSDSLRVAANYYVFGKEIAPSTGQKHWQGYVQFHTQRTGTSILKLFPKGVHLERAMGDAIQNKDYCTKDDKDPLTHGTPRLRAEANRTNGASTIRALMEMVREGATDLECMEVHPTGWVLYSKQLREYRKMIRPNRDWVTEVVVVTGKTGTGKTRAANADGAQFVDFRYPFTTGYNGENDVVVFDDFHWKKMPITYALRLTDRYQMEIECKGGLVNWCPRRIYFTSNIPLEDWWPEATQEHRDAFRRRVTKHIELENEVTPKEFFQRFLQRHGRSPSAGPPHKRTKQSGPPSPDPDQSKKPKYKLNKDVWQWEEISDSEEGECGLCQCGRPECHGWGEDAFLEQAMCDPYQDYRMLTTAYENAVNHTLLRPDWRPELLGPTFDERRWTILDGSRLPALTVDDWQMWKGCGCICHRHIGAMGWRPDKLEYSPKACCCDQIQARQNLDDFDQHQLIRILTLRSMMTPTQSPNSPSTLCARDGAMVTRSMTSHN